MPLRLPGEPKIKRRDLGAFVPGRRVTVLGEAV